MAFSEFYCDSAAPGSNLNAGSTTSSGAVYSGVGDSDGVNNFTPSDGSTPANSVNVGDFASVFLTVGTTVTTFVGRVTAVAAGVNGAITVSTTAKAGAFPAASSGAHTITCRTGGAWAGPSGAVEFPLGFITAALTDAAGDIPRVNLKNGASYAVTSAMTHSLAGPIRFQGMTAAPADGGQAVIDGGTSGASYIVLTVSGADVDVKDIIFQNNGASGSAALVSATGGRNQFNRCVFSNCRGHGLSASSSGGIGVVECEFFGCNQSNTGVTAGAFFANNGWMKRCYVHDNVGSNTFGVYNTGGVVTFDRCIFDSNGSVGLNINVSTAFVHVSACDFYGNGGNGLNIVATTVIVDVENCNFAKNIGYGIDLHTAGTRHGRVYNCGFGSGTQQNTVGQINSPASVEVVGSVTYAANLTPWNAPATGDFTITLAAAKAAGRGGFTETGSGSSGTVGYPDIGAAQSKALAGGGRRPTPRRIG